MAVRWRKYHSQCKTFSCNGRRSKACPETPKKQNGQYRACGVWAIEFFDDNRQWQSLTFKDIRNKTDAEKRLFMFVSDRERGRLLLPKKKTIPTLTEYGQIYLGFYKNAKETTLHNKKTAVNNLTKYLGAYRLDKITSFVIRKFQIDRQEKDGAKPGTINEDFSNLRNMLNRAINEDIIDQNPCKGIKKLKVTQTRDRILSELEINLLIETLQGRDRIAILLGLFCGLRLNETLRLKWSDIDFSKNLLNIYQSKTNKAVLMPLSSFMIDELSRYRMQCDSENLFEGDMTRNKIGGYGEYFRRVFKKLGIHHFSYHCLRHSFATLCSDIGSDIFTTKELLGHSDITMTARYTHKQKDVKRAAIESLTNHILSMKHKTSLALAQ